MATTKTLKAADIRLGETIIYSGAEFTVARLAIKGDMIHVTPADGGMEQVIWGERDVELVGTRGRKQPPLVHFNRFAAEGTVRVQPIPFSHASMNCGATPTIQVYAKDVALVTCPRCAKQAEQDAMRRR